MDMALPNIQNIMIVKINLSLDTRRWPNVGLN